jgi:hypothetical protein
VPGTGRAKGEKGAKTAPGRVDGRKVSGGPVAEREKAGARGCSPAGETSWRRKRKTAARVKDRVKVKVRGRIKVKARAKARARAAVSRVLLRAGEAGEAAGETADRTKAAAVSSTGGRWGDSGKGEPDRIGLPGLEAVVVDVDDQAGRLAEFVGRGVLPEAAIHEDFEGANRGSLAREKAVGCRNLPPRPPPRLILPLMKPLSALLALLLPALVAGCSREPGTPPPAAPAAAPDPELKRLVEIVQEARKIARDPGASPEDRARLEPMQKEAEAIMTRRTGLDPKKDGQKFGEAASRVLMEAARLHAPEWHRELVEQEKKMHATLAEARVKNVQMALEQYELLNGRFPTAEEGLDVLRKGTPEAPALVMNPDGLMDPWGRKLVYRPEAKGFRLFSLGPDGKEGTPDDIPPR